MHAMRCTSTGNPLCHRLRAWSCETHDAVSTISGLFRLEIVKHLHVPVQELISIFNDHELELLISGLPEIDVDDLRANTEYTGFTPKSPVIQYFWEVVRDMDKEDLALLVQFVTGTSKVPLEGFKSLQVRPNYLSPSTT